MEIVIQKEVMNSYVRVTKVHITMWYGVVLFTTYKRNLDVETLAFVVFITLSKLQNNRFDFFFFYSSTDCKLIELPSESTLMYLR